MNARVQLLDSLQGAPAHLAEAILLYKTHDDSVSYATIHPIRSEEGMPVALGAGKPLELDALTALTQLMIGEQSTDFIPVELLSLGPDSMVWYVPPGRRTLYFNAPNSVGICNAKVELPMMVFAVKGSEMFLYTCKGKDRPTPETPLLTAPFFNVWGQGNLCIGSAKIPERIGADWIREWNRTFFDSAFSHPNQGSEALTQYRGGMTALWRSILKMRQPKLRLSHCLDAGFKLSHLIRSLKSL
jgi:PRTRC genetic system protein B